MAAQRISVEVHAGGVASTPLLQDPVAGFQTVAGAPVSRDLEVTPSPAPYLGASLRAGFWRRAELEAAAGWSRSKLRVSEEAGSRSTGAMSVMHGTLGVAWRARPRVELGLAAGVIRHDGGESGILAGTSTSALAEARAGWVLPVLRERATVRLALQTHRFGTQPIREAGGTDGTATRLALYSTFRVF